VKRQPIGENLANHISNKSLISIICKELLKLKNQKTTLIKNWAKYVIRYFFKEDIQMANKPLKGCLASLVIREM